MKFCRAYRTTTGCLDALVFHELHGSRANNQTYSYMDLKIRSRLPSLLEKEQKYYRIHEQTLKSYIS